jgi:hypothetical protein
MLQGAPMLPGAPMEPAIVGGVLNVARCDLAIEERGVAGEPCGGEGCCVEPGGRFDEMDDVCCFGGVGVIGLD